MSILSLSLSLSLMSTEPKQLLFRRFRSELDHLHIVSLITLRIVNEIYMDVLNETK